MRLRRYKLHSIAAIVLLLLVAAALSQERGRTVFHGSYSFMPSFMLDTGFDVDDYDRITGLITGTLKEKVRTCQLPPPNFDPRRDVIWSLQDCVPMMSREMNSIDETLDWKVDSACDSDNEVVFNRFVEGYKLCRESPGRNCICQIEMQKPGTPDGEYIIEIRPQGDDTKFKLVKPPTDITAVERGHLWLVVKPMLDDPYLQPINPWAAYEVEYKGGSVDSASLDVSRIMPDKELSDYGIIRMWKDPEGKLAFLEEEDYMETKVPETDLLFRNLTDCQTHKNIFRFCVTKKNPDGSTKEVMTIDEDGKMQRVPLVYRFAVYFETS
jgi:hypothetical protein